ncbi:MAG: glycoside hydrolase family 15 protein [Candidatus Omnitrophica bacterium]|nr:glycoside hydrolase family 15 protein [Candidatus Omnitrophota bacterium]
MNNYNYAIIGNCTTAALVSAKCSIDWLCMPFFDSPSLFAKILDDKKGGSFKISAVGIISITQAYIPCTPILKTVFKTKHGIFEVRDYMPRYMIEKNDFYCPPEIHRDILVVKGKPRIIFELDPKPNYATSESVFEVKDEYVKISSKTGEYNSFYMYTDLCPKKILSKKSIEVKKAARIIFSYHQKLTKMDVDNTLLEYEKTKTYWLDWSFNKNFPEKYRSEVVRSMITLKLLMYQRTGAVIAAPTTSLPEIIGKNRNWDYRYCWVRDASMIVDLYARIGDMRSANRFINFILNRMLLKHENIAVMYGINGEKDLKEKTLDHLDGYLNSKPVRIGNAAYTQKQNDIYGALVETIYTYFFVNKAGDISFDEEMWTVVRSMVREVEKCWDKKDSGIWEKRGPMQHYVHSKMMSWVAMDRASKIARWLGKAEYVEQWGTLALSIKEDILKNGWSEKKQSFVMHYGSEDLDASNLLMLHYGFLDKNDPRIVSTVKQAYKHLSSDGFVFRYIAEDDFGKPENAFLVCSFWMINALFIIGEKDIARKMFEKVLGFANKHGLYAEDVEIATKRMTGNFPQGYSHLAFVQTVLLLETEYNWRDVFCLKK